MSKSVVINLGSGDLYKGFPRVTAQLWAAGYPRPEQFIGSLPAAPALAESYRTWQSIYKALCSRLVLFSRGPDDDDDELEIDEGGITQVSEVSFDALGQQLHESLNAWLKSVEFLNIERQLRSQLDPSEEIRVIIETNDEQLRRLPWHCWDFVEDYYYSEAALSRPEYKRIKRSPSKINRKKVRILAVLGNSQGIDLEVERRFLKGLPDAETVFLVNPSRHEFNEQLWNSQGWDILFFAGHSQSEGKTGRIYLNENKTNNSLTVEQLKEALKEAIKNDLYLAIFNSCDGLGLANALGKLNLPQIIVMREPVPNRVAQEFFKHFLSAFASQRSPLYSAVRQARRQLQGLENEFPSASWLPVISQNPAVEPPTWLQLGGIPPCPYRGLSAFREEDAHLFCGREEFTANLLKEVKSKPLVAVVGASGSGKSSVVFAGLIPHLQQDTDLCWQIVSFRPGNNPVDSLAAALVPLWQQRENNQEDNLASRDNSIVELELFLALRRDELALSKLIKSLVESPKTRLLLIADQFEELYTLSNQAERQFFLTLLLNAVKFAPAFTLVLTLRADFYGYILGDRSWSDALQGAIQNLGSMSRSELQLVIEKPAALMQVKLEQGLTDKLINNVWEQPGRLPLLEFALTQLWSKQQHGLLTHQAYSEIGGVSSALANHAEAVYAQLSETDKQLVQQVFLQLVRLGEETEATRRLATRDEIKAENWDLVTRLASARLVVTNHRYSTGKETVEIVHESLIKSWGRLQQWLLLDGDFRRWQEQLRTAIGQWQWQGSSSNQDTLLRGKPLTDASNWLQKRFQELTDSERSFIQASLEQRNNHIKAEKRRQQWTILGLTLGSILAVSLMGVARWQWQKVRIGELYALTKSSEVLFADNDRLNALVKAIAAQEKLQKLGRVDTKLQNQVESILRRSIYGANESNRLSGHHGAVWGVAFSPDGQTIASTSWDNTIKLWSRNGKELKTITGHVEEVWGVAFSPDGQTIATASGDNTVKLWQHDGTLLKTLTGHGDIVYSVAFSPDGQAIATASGDNTVKLWQRDGTLVKTLTGHEASVWGVAFNPNGQTIASAGWDKKVKLWSRDGALLKTLESHQAPVNALAFSPDGQTIATASNDKTVKLWSRDGTLLKTLEGHDDDVWGISFSPDGQTFASVSGDKTVKLWSRDGTLLQTLEGHDDEVWGVSFSPDGQTLASAGDDKTIRLWQRDNKLLTTLSSHSAGVNGVAFSPDEQLIASAGWDKTVKLWNSNGSLLKTLIGHSAAINALAFEPGGNIIATASADNTVKFWQRDGTLLKTLIGHRAGVNAVVFSPDGEIVASASADTTVKLWSREGTLLKTLTGHRAGVNAVVFSPDGEMVASASADNTVKFWSRDGTELKTFKAHGDRLYALAFSFDGQMLATASADNTVKLWNRDGTELKTLNGHNGTVWGVAFSPDGQTIATASGDNTVNLWKLDGTLLTTLNAHNSAVNAIAFNSDGNRLTSASEDRTVIVWDLNRVRSLDEILAYSCDWVQHYLQNNANVNPEALLLCGKIENLNPQ
ncbi:CHAT domain-containing protein [Pleurocapsa sp. PCC 7319]|uniref:nSTAND1 domain-containing NTPase n=1 Tax=Pleurocapsa sp. PCC 7319 TaxID=118161 RepID=UPI00037D6851|nr:CHAT domain-containing protein [Pleurocapsa sp. PCC 7319]